MKNVPFVILLIFLVASCKEDSEKKNYTSVAIHVMDPVTNMPIQDVTCKVFEQNGIGQSTLITSGVTQGGTFEFGFLASKKKTYFVTCEANLEKYDIVYFNQYIVLEKNQNNIYNFELVPKSNLRYGYKNINCIDVNDAIIIYLENIDVPSYNGFYPQWKYGCLDVLTSFSKIPSGQYHWEWHVTKSGITNVFHDTISLNEGDSLTYLIEY